MKTSTALLEGSEAAGLVTTDKGAATLIIRGRQAALTEFSREGAVVSEAPVPCHGPEALLSLWGNPANVSPDGSITEFPSAGAVIRRASWIRPGTVAGSLSDGRLAILDQETGERLRCGGAGSDPGDRAGGCEHSTARSSSWRVWPYDRIVAAGGQSQQ